MGAVRTLIVTALMAILMLMPVTARAQTDEEPDGRAHPSFVEGVIDSDGQLWFKIGFYNTWDEEPPRDIFSLYWQLNVITDDAAATVGWETHDGIETFLGDEGTEAYILDNGCVIIATGLRPTGEFQVSIVSEYASLESEGDEVRTGFTSMGTSSEFIDMDDPFTAFGGTPVWDLTTGQPFGSTPSTTSTTTTTEAASSPSSTSAGSTDAETTAVSTTADDGGGFPWWLFGFAGLLLLATWYFWRTGRLLTNTRYAYRVDTPGMETIEEDADGGASGDDDTSIMPPPPVRSGPQTFSPEDRELLQEIYQGANEAGYKIAGIASIDTIEEVKAGSKDDPVVIGTAAKLTVRVGTDGSLLPRGADTDQSAASILEIDVRPGVEFGSDGTAHVVWNAHVRQVDVETGRILETSKSGPSTEEWREKVDGRSDAEIGEDRDFKDWVVESMPDSAAEAVEQALGNWSPAGP